MSSNPFWEYSLKLYQLPRVTKFCLSLQDRVNTPASGDVRNRLGELSESVNVNILLFCCWAGVQGMILNRSDFDALDATIRDWHANTVLALRSQRRGIDVSEQQKQLLLQREIAAERVEQDMLFSWFEGSCKHDLTIDNNFDGKLISENIRCNMLSYCERLSLSVDANNPLQRAATNIVF